MDGLIPLVCILGITFLAVNRAIIMWMIKKDDEGEHK